MIARKQILIARRQNLSASRQNFPASRQFLDPLSNLTKKWQLCTFSGKVRITRWNTSKSFRVKSKFFFVAVYIWLFHIHLGRTEKNWMQSLYCSSMSNNWQTIEERIQHMKTRAFNNLTESNGIHESLLSFLNTE